jgi:hypothetical protein
MGSPSSAGRGPGDRSDLKSLFVLSLPRSFSSAVHEMASRLLGLAEPIWTQDGEILNLDRMAFYTGPRLDEGVKFTTRETDPVLFQRLTDFLGEIVVRRGYAYKDVVHPFVVSEWAGLAELRVLKIRRNLAEVALSVLEQGWRYPAQAAIQATDSELALLEGLIRAEHALEAAPGDWVQYDDLVTDEAHLRRALARLYPEVDLPRFGYINRAFVRQRDRVLARRASARFGELQAKERRARDIVEAYRAGRVLVEP